jgi:hypothetical protein
MKLGQPRELLLMQMLLLALQQAVVCELLLAGIFLQHFNARLDVVRIKQCLSGEQSEFEG